MKKLIIAVMLLCSCTANTRAKSFGGTETINLPECTKLVNVTWKENQLWFVSRPFRDNEKPEIFTFKEESALGLIEGQVNFIESCSK